MPAKVTIDFVANEGDLINAAKNAQKEMDALSKRLKAAGVSQSAYNQAMAAARRQYEENTRATQKQGFAFTELSSMINLAAQALQKLKAAYDFAKEGAQIEFAAIKFDRLAATIGATGDALTDKLLVATRGTMSEMEAMASASDLISLGLVKTEEDVIRLSTVVSGLGMDMNQLVLALSNQTTMRFDQLGVAVVGFDEKVKALEKTGMSAQDAFTEAFLQQAEEQLLKVGNAADTSLGQFMRFEAQLKDVRDEAKMAAAQGLGPLVGWLAESMKETREFNEALKAADEELYNQHLALGIVTPEMQKAVEAYRASEETLKANAEAVKIATDRYDEMNASLGMNADAVKLSEEQIKAMDSTNRQFLGVLGQVTAAQTTYYDGLAAVNQELADGKITTEEHSAKVAQLAADYKQASADIVMSIIEMKLAQDGWTDAELNAYLNIGQAQGKFTADQVKAAQGAIKSADDLVAAYTNLEEPMMHVGERAADTAEDFGLMEMAGYELAEAAYEAQGGVGAVKSQLQGLPPSGSAWEYNFQINVHGRVPNLPNQTANIGSGQVDQFDYHNQMGGEVYAGVPSTVGEAGPEPFIPAINGRILGRREALHALAGTGGMGGSRNYFYGPVTIMSDTETGGDIMSLR